MRIEGASFLSCSLVASPADPAEVGESTAPVSDCCCVCKIDVVDESLLFPSNDRTALLAAAERVSAVFTPRRLLATGGDGGGLVAGPLFVVGLTGGCKNCCCSCRWLLLFGLSGRDNKLAVGGEVDRLLLAAIAELLLKGSHEGRFEARLGPSRLTVVPVRSRMFSIDALPVLPLAKAVANPSTT